MIETDYLIDNLMLHYFSPFYVMLAYNPNDPQLVHDVLAYMSIIFNYFFRRVVAKGAILNILINKIFLKPTSRRKWCQSTHACVYILSTHPLVQVETLKIPANIDSALKAEEKFPGIFRGSESTCTDPFLHFYYIMRYYDRNQRSMVDTRGINPYTTSGVSHELNPNFLNVFCLHYICIHSKKSDTTSVGYARGMNGSINVLKKYKPLSLTKD